MKSIVTLLGILLIVGGIAALGWQGFTYTKQEPVAQIGDVKLIADTQKTVYFPPWLSGISVLAGVVLVIVGRKSN
ncbi:MAG TPA: hypothetical protein VLJ15_03520 [Gammaproteobacteria bacterium]|nr:hypothetical protein [Gammaproteobacteria bacterium]